MNILRKNKGDGIAVIVYGVTLMLVFVFLAINIVNGKIIENGYNSLRDSIQSASVGSVIHLLASSTGVTDEQDKVINNNGLIERDSSIPAYDIYLQLALGYIINRAPKTETSSETVETGSVNNFIKLDHKRVVNSTLALLEDSVIRGVDSQGKSINIHNTDYFKILMIFIEPHYNNTTYEKYYNVIVYGNKEGTEQGKTYLVGTSKGDLNAAYKALNNTINTIVNSNDPTVEGNSSMAYALLDSSGKSRGIAINVNLADGNGDKGETLMRKMETKPYYMIVVKDFALPTLFRQHYTHSEESENIFKQLFKEISGDGHLQTPIIALNSAKIERKLDGSKK